MLKAPVPPLHPLLSLPLPRCCCRHHCRCCRLCRYCCCCCLWPLPLLLLPSLPPPLPLLLPPSPSPLPLLLSPLDRP